MALLLGELLGDFAADGDRFESDDGGYFWVGGGLSLAPCDHFRQSVGSCVLTQSAPGNDRSDVSVPVERDLAGTGLALLIDGRWVGGCGGGGFHPRCGGDKRSGCGLILEVSR